MVQLKCRFPAMAFMMKKKKYKFTVELCLEEITAVPFLNGVLFAKVRLLDGKSFMDTSSREEVQDHKVKWGAKFEFVCKMSANASTGVLDPCMLRVSVRKELKGGRSFQKLGFTDLNLAEFAGSGLIQRKCLLEGYDPRRRQDNSMLSVTISMNMISGDVLFKVPSPAKTRPEKPSGEVRENDEKSEKRDDFSSGSLASVSSGFSSLTKKRPFLLGSEITAENEDNNGLIDCYGGVAPPLDEGLEMGHSRNPSNTSQMSKASGYGSMNSQHSRQSSSGDSGHIRCPSWPVWSPTLAPVPSTPPLSAAAVATVQNFWASPLLLKRKGEGSPLATPKNVPSFRFPPWSAPRATSSPGLFNQPSPSTPKRPLSPLAKNPPLEHHERGLRKVSESCKLSLVSGEDMCERIDISQTMTRVVYMNNGGSCLVETGSLDRGKAALERRKKAAEEGPGSGRVEFTRVNTNSIIDEVLKATNLEHGLEKTDDDIETEGLQLFIGKDGRPALGNQEVKSQMSTGVFKQVVIEENR